MSLLEYKKYEPFFGAWYFDGDACTLGSGTFGSVFCIKRFDANVKPSALKIITIPKSDSEINTHRSEGMTNDDIKNYYKKMVDDIKGEYELMSELKGCSNIVSCEDFMAYQHEDGIGYDIFIRMELLTPLIQYENSRGLTELEIMKFGIDMCNALDRCESKKIIHRDIKPDNIFISDMGDFKLGDFGIARTMESSIRMMSRKGTPNYMAPEVYFSKPYDHTADIYSLGIVMYRMLNNSRLPFLPQPPATVGREEREQAFLKRIRGEVPERPVYGDEALKSIVMKACAFTSHDRYHHARDMKNDLELVYSIIKNGQEVPKQFAIDLDATVAMTNVGLNTGQIVSEDRESIKKSFRKKLIISGVSLLSVAGIMTMGYNLTKNKGTQEAIKNEVKVTETETVTVTNEPIITPEPTLKYSGITELELDKKSTIKLEEIKEYPDLKKLVLSEYEIYDISLLNGLDNLESLSVNNNLQSLDISGIPDLKNLKELDLSLTAVENIDVIKNYKELNSLNISITTVSDISSIKNLSKLTDLNISYNDENMTSKSVVKTVCGMSQLQKLDVSSDSIFGKNCDYIGNLQSLYVLKVASCGISNINFIKKLKNLEELDIQSNLEVVNGDDIFKLTNLKKLNLSATGITNISGIENLSELKELDITLTDVNDLMVLGKMKQLENVRVTGSKNINKQIEKLKKILPKCTFEVL